MRLHSLAAAWCLGLFGLTGCAAPSTPHASRILEDSVVLVDIGGSSHDVTAALRAGRSATLVFWQTWCATCKEEGPDLAAAARTWSGKIDFFGVVSGPDEVVDGDEVRAVAESLALPYPQVRDRDGSIADRFAVESTPTILVIGPDGRELYRGKNLPTDWKRFAAN